MILTNDGDITEASIIDYFSYFNKILNLALDKNEINLDTISFIEIYDRLLTLLGVMPFNEKELPSEDQTTS